ncbi:MAG: protein phosphatase 2C domain-containing protein [Myxococcota bacterium]
MSDEMRVSFGFPLRVAVRTDVGRVRTNNEDSHGFAWLPDGSLFVIVADGMGGHEAGEVASGLAVQVLEEVVARDVATDPRERLYRGLLEANEAILQEGRASGTRGMGTTTVAALCRGAEVHVGLVGDSRLYHVRRGQLLWRTLDHTRVQMLIEQGQVPEVEARHHPESGMLTRALGHSRMADGRPLVPDVLAEPLVIDRDDALVMCSDGLHDLLEDWEIARLIAGREPDDAAQALVSLAVERGGHDNVTVAVIVAGERTAELDEDYVPEVGADAPPAPSADVEGEGEGDEAPPPPEEPEPAPAPAAADALPPLQEAAADAVDAEPSEASEDDGPPAPPEPPGSETAWMVAPSVALAEEARADALEPMPVAPLVSTGGGPADETVQRPRASLVAAPAAPAPVPAESSGRGWMVGGALAAVILVGVIVTCVIAAMLLAGTAIFAI